MPTCLLLEGVLRLVRAALRLSAIIILGALAAAILEDHPAPGTVRKNRTAATQNTVGDAGYVGSKVCASCHRRIYTEFSQTEMGRSMSNITPALLAKIPTPASVFDQLHNRHFEVYVRDGSLYESEYETAPSGKEVFRDMQKVEWMIGAGSNGLGAIVRRDDHLFEAPLSFYAKPQKWALSPGYEFHDYGFGRPIVAGCIVCHSGQPQPVLGGNGRFRDPPFKELAIGCENCHGPGAMHVFEMQGVVPFAEDGNLSIVNPAKLPPWLANNICMSCHQTGDARVLKPDKNDGDFQPGEPLDNTLAIFMVPPRREAPPQTDLLQHYFSMVLSKCYQGSAGQLRCISCHDSHSQPMPEEAAGNFREKCLACHAERSCAVPLAVRLRKSPPNDCAGCHMPKRNVQVISHSVLTNHRIMARTEEPFPEATFHLATPQLPDLIHLNAVPGREDSPPSPHVLLQAYSQLILTYPQYRERYFALAKELEKKEPENVEVLEALAARALAQKSTDAAQSAIQYLHLAVGRGSTSPADYEQLASLLLQTGRTKEALDILQRGARLIPYDAELYRLQAQAYLVLNKPADALSILKEALRIAPQDAVIRKLLEESEARGLNQ